MFAQERHRKMAELIKEKGSVKAAELMELFSISVETVRRDLIFLETQGVLQRVYGGAVVREKDYQFADYDHRLQENAELKRRLSETAAGFIREGDIIAIDAGSTAVEFCGVLKKRFERLTIVTYSILLVQELMGKRGFELILPGGILRQDQDGILSGGMMLENLRMLHVNKSIIFPSAVSLEHGIEDFPSMSDLTQRELLRIADQVIVAADSSKYHARALLKICDVSPSHIYVTDDSLDEETAAAFAERGIPLFRGDVL